MKKQLEAELISIAHRILKLKNKSDLNQLHQETRNLYEKLTVLRFAEEHFSDVKPTIGLTEVEEKLQAETVFEPEVVVPEASEVAPEPELETVAESTPEPIAEEPEEVTIELSVEQTQDSNQDEVEAESELTDETAHEETPDTETEEKTAEEPEPEVDEQKIVFHLESDDLEDDEIQDESFEEQSEDSDELIEETIGDSIEAQETPQEDNAFKPAFELTFDIKDEAPEPEIKSETKSASQQITLDDLLGPNYADPVFVKPEDLAKEAPLASDPSSVIPISRSYNSDAPVISINKEGQSLNDRLSKGIIIGLNDRIAFMNHLFANSSEDYNRVLSQLMTFDTFADAKDFIDNMVKPDYNNWEGKDEYAERFMEIVEKRFS
ncbi:hypothetical protein KIH23_01695 [Flavobacterium sp. CYK-55]|uniref:hypothetical protein n=1 Tax=Flavobacterium sp. CYK-55 TaxID=2835529 RepID=UPI001BCC0A1F|nr:hypothetical protein [Flavobacterium sp. CYK-55]MBS7785996.1 hypothetical protein [Flavobacterium sp. CYK-55]